MGKLREYVKANFKEESQRRYILKTAAAEAFAEERVLTQKEIEEICYVQDLIIRPEVQGEGIGGLILETLKKFVIQEGYEGTTMMFDLMCAKGREEFYKKHGFIARPTEDLGPGMIQFIQIGEEG